MQCMYMRQMNEFNPCITAIWIRCLLQKSRECVSVWSHDSTLPDPSPLPTRQGLLGRIQSNRCAFIPRLVSLPTLLSSAGAGMAGVVGLGPAAACGSCLPSPMAAIAPPLVLASSVPSFRESETAGVTVEFREQLLPLQSKVQG